MLTPEQVKYIKEIRRTLHRSPELSGEESNTAFLIKGYLETFEADKIVDSVGGAGIYAIYNGEKPDSGKTLLIRAELDALAVKEKTDLPYSSEEDGKMHACGHDGHMAIVLGVAKWLQKNRPKTGKVVLMFQPAEETGEGASRVLEDSRFKNLKIDRAIALHNLPGFKKNTIYIRRGTFASASVGVQISFAGRSSHAAFPDQGINPATTVSDMINRVEKLKTKHAGSDRFRVLTITYIKVGERAFGINPGTGEMGVTVRAETDKEIDTLLSEMESELEEADKLFEGSISYKKREPFAATVNDDEGIDQLLHLLDGTDIEIEELTSPFAWSEDFGEFRKHCPITLFGIGAGSESPPLHSETYDFEDELIPVGISVFCKWIKMELK